jgi:DNA excision repair protein ERCC-4
MPKPQELTILVDTREQTPPPFPDGVRLERATLSEGDYTGHWCQGIAVIERKSLNDFASSITHERERFEDMLRRLSGYRWKCIVVEGELSDVYRERCIHPHSVLGSIASFQARYDCATLFAVNAAGAGRLIAGLIRRWEERLAAEGAQREPDTVEQR